MGEFRFSDTTGASRLMGMKRSAGRLPRIDPTTVSDVELARHLDALVSLNRAEEADELVRRVARARGNTGAAILRLDALGGNG